MPEYNPLDGAIETSPFNFDDSFYPYLAFPDEVRLADTTLRDGEQTPGVVFSPEDKLAIARRLDSVGVSRIEAGNPELSATECYAIEQIASDGLDADVFVLSKATKEAIDQASELGVDGVYIYPRADEFDLSETDYETDGFDSAFAVSRYALDNGLDVTFFAFDIGRVSLSFIDEFFDVVGPEITTTVSLVDQVGIANPLAVQHVVEHMVSESDVPIEAHLHNDFGLATANALFAASAGAEVIDVTMNGLGERTGNPALVEVAAGLEHLFGADPGIDLSEMRSLAVEVERRSTVELPPDKPFTGDDIFDFVSGMIISGLQSRGNDFLPYDPEMVGQTIEYHVGKHAERPSVDMMLKEVGVDPDVLTDKEHAELLDRVIEQSETQQRPLEDNEFYGMVRDIRPDMDI